MASMHCTAANVLRDVFRSNLRQILPPPAFLLPAFASQQRSSFSTSPVVEKRARKDGNTRRGMSPLKRTGFNRRFKVSVKLADLPKPVLDPALRTQVETDPNHGLWQFFDEGRNPMMTPTALNAHGRGWAVLELRRKDFDDLWKLWWVCIREKNRIKTSELERARMKVGYGEHEAGVRQKELRKTMGSIKHVLTERWYQFEDARVLAETDPEVDMYANPAAGEQPYIPARMDASPIVDDAVEDDAVEDDSTSSAQGPLPPGFMAEEASNATTPVARQ